MWTLQGLRMVSPRPGSTTGRDGSGPIAGHCEHKEFPRALLIAQPARRTVFGRAGGRTNVKILIRSRRVLATLSRRGGPGATLPGSLAASDLSPGCRAVELSRLRRGAVDKGRRHRTPPSLTPCWKASSCATIHGAALGFVRHHPLPVQHVRAPTAVEHVQRLLKFKERRVALLRQHSLMTNSLHAQALQRKVGHVILDARAGGDEVLEQRRKGEARCTLCSCERCS